MLTLDEDAFICDMAETYHIYDYKSVPCRLLGTLAAGLRDSSRIKQKLAGITSDPQTVLLASVLDVLQLILWTKTEDAQKGSNRPKSVSDKYFVKEAPPKHENDLTPAEYEEIRNKILKRDKKCQEQNSEKHTSR